MVTHLNGKKESFFRLRLRFYGWKEFTCQYHCIAMLFNGKKNEK